MVMDRFQVLWRSRVQTIQTIFAVGITTLGLGLVYNPRAYGQVVSAQDSIQTQVIQLDNQVNSDYRVVGGTLSDDASLLFHSFEKFDLGRGQTAEFHVTPGVDSVLGRIINGVPSHINGMIEVSGGPASLYLINPAGVLFGPESSINLAGDFTVLTANRLDFIQGNFALVGHPEGIQGPILQLHFAPDDPATIVNLGDLKVGADHSLSLIGHTVVNVGTLRGGAINIAAVGSHGEVLVADGLQFGPVPLRQTGPGQTGPRQTLPPWLTSEETEHASAIELAEDGSLRLTGSLLSTLEELPWGTALVGGELTTMGQPTSQLNRIQILGDHVATMAATIQAADGGRILIGGDYQGSGFLPTAQSTFVDVDTALVADGERGGQVVVWSDGHTQFRGTISAQGLLAGGSVEISGKEQLYFGGQVDLRSQGTPGTLLLDPENIEIRAGSDPGSADTSEPQILYEDTLESSILGNTHLILQADNDITIKPLSDGALTFAQETISISFLADADGDGQGRFTMAPGDRLEAPEQDIYITGAEITVGDISTSAFATIDNSESAGEIRLTATQGSINGGDLTSTAGASLNNHGNGGNIVLSAMDTITIGAVDTATNALSNTGEAGAITLLTPLGNITTGRLSTLTSGGSNNTGSGGDINLSAMGHITTGDITTSARASTNNSGTAGNVSLSSQLGNLTIGSIAVDTTADSSNMGHGGTLSLQATQGTILTDAITATAISPDMAGTRGGTIQLSAAEDIVIDSANATGTGQGGNIEIVTQQSIRVVDTIANRTIPVSLLTTDGGTIRLNYSSDPTVPFSLGNSEAQGTVGSISTGVDTLNAPQTITQAISLDTIELKNLFEPPPVSPPVSLPPTPQLPVAPPVPQPDLTGPPEVIPTSLEQPNSSDIEILQRNTPGTDDKNSGPEVLQDRVISHDELIWVQIETAFTSEFAQALNLPIPTAPSLQEIQQNLAQVSYTQNITPALMYIRLKEDHIELVLVGSEGSPIYRPVPVTAAEVQTVMDTFQQTITNPVLRPAQYLPAAQQLFDWFVGPMVDDLTAANIDHIGFILDRGLRSIPMAALHDGQRFLIEDYSIGLLPSAGLTSLEPTSGIVIGAGYAAEVGAHAPGATLAMGITDFEHQADLEAVPLELALASQRQNDEYYLNHEFTLEALTQRLEGSDFTTVHLATHALFQPGNLEASYVQFWDQTVNLSQLQELPLDAIDFLILSACATALGDHEAEFGFAGLALNVGVKTALASLWSISDEGTLGLMSEFYRAMEQTLGRSAALRQAQLAMLQGHVGIRNGTVYGDGDRIIGHLPGLDASGSWDFSHPAYWSGFTMIGNPW
ncbi:CHAT domain-containing protein [Leptothoe sp. PORK10 BA2]|uniref:CHAT domain-containing protein n=1 Tax=Leptothoe sp. PORK10 BA2 TaxID=3110254 RepID=UPI002B1F5B26|nr:CHAT domain-containing protein [Leptothoe sp. PORK10 BA2]MEA5463510.1 CHAT domain-containing protein [Leptothoe sp. PORK10 BA2]